MCLCNNNDLSSRLEDLESLLADDEKDEIESLIDSGDCDDAKSMIDELENERT